MPKGCAIVVRLEIPETRERMSLQETLASIRSSPTRANEESAKFKIIAPILRSLGWDMFGPQVLLEYSVGDKKAGGRVDIALKGSRGVVALIEAKTPGADLSGHVSQVLGYAFHEGVDICALTTGLEWWLYLPREKGQPEERKFAVLNIIDDPVDGLAQDFEAFLSNHALEASDAGVSDAVSQAERVLKAQRERTLLSEKIPSIWQRMIEEADEELLDVISRRVYSEVNLRPDKEQVVAVLKGQPVTTTHVPKKSPKKATPPVSSGPAGRPTAMVLFGNRYPIKTHADGLVTLAEVLYERDQQAFSRLLELHGRKRKFVSRDPKQAYRPRQVGTSGYYLDINLSAETVWKRASLFLHHLGHEDSDLEFRFD